MRNFSTAGDTEIRTENLPNTRLEQIVRFLLIGTEPLLIQIYQRTYKQRLPNLAFEPLEGQDQRFAQSLSQPKRKHNFCGCDTCTQCRSFKIVGILLNIVTETNYLISAHCITRTSCYENASVFRVLLHSTANYYRIADISKEVELSLCLTN
jgi:hypothetical protein